MLKPKPEDTPLLVALAAIAFSFYLLWGTSPMPQRQPTNPQTQQKEQWHTPLSGLWDWLGRDSTSFFTAVLALFSGVLVVYNGWQIRLGRQEFLATHRPEIVIHSVQYNIKVGMNGPNSMTIGAVVLFYNKGTTPAQIIMVRGKIARRPKPLTPDLWADNIAIRSPTVGSGMGDFINIASDISIDDHMFLSSSDAAPQQIYCFGRIIYADGRGAKRTTGFCRRLKRAETGSSDNWVTVEEQGYGNEFAY